MNDTQNSNLNSRIDIYTIMESAGVNIIAEFDTSLRGYIEGIIGKLTPSILTDIVDLAATDRNAGAKEEILRIKAQLDNTYEQLTRLLGEKTRQIDNICKQDETNIKHAMARLTRVKTVRTTIKTPVVAAPATPPEIVGVKLPLQPTARTLIKITPALAIPAMIVHTFDRVLPDGNLYYVDTHNHFAIKINDKLLHGNIGSIINDDRVPTKIKPCKFRNGCNKGGRCDYYHDPMVFAGSKDVRNYTAHSWMYAKHRDCRRYGSLENLDTDIVSIDQAERDKYYDQTMHDLLCTLLLKFNS